MGRGAGGDQGEREPGCGAGGGAGRGAGGGEYTQNVVVAAPVTVGREHLAATGGRVSAVLVNAGNANCATGEAGVEACRLTCLETAKALGCIFDEVFPSSTGIIGVPLPTEKMLAALPELKASLGETPAHAASFATAIMTTDTVMKVARAVVDVDGMEVRIFGVAKGAGMIAPSWECRWLRRGSRDDAGVPVYGFEGGDGGAAGAAGGGGGGELQQYFD